MDRARSSSPRSPLHLSAPRQQAMSLSLATASLEQKQERPSGSRPLSPQKKKKGAQNSSPRSPISQHFPILLLLSQLHSRFPQTRSLSHMKKIKPPSKVSNKGHILWSNQVTEPPRDSHLLVILLPCKVKCISLIDKESWAKS